MSGRIVGEVRPCKRFEWERIIRRTLLDDKHIGHLLPAGRRPTAASAVKLVAFTLATYANQDGSNVRPGDEKVARVTGSSRRTVIAARTVLLDLGLLELVRSGRGRTIASEYQLTAPDDLLDHVPMLPPKESDDGSSRHVITPGRSDSTSRHDVSHGHVTPDDDVTSRHDRRDISAPMTRHVGTNDVTPRHNTGTRPPTTSPSPSVDEASSTTGSHARARAHAHARERAREAAEQAKASRR